MTEITRTASLLDIARQARVLTRQVLQKYDARHQDKDLMSLSDLVQEIEFQALTLLDPSKATDEQLDSAIKHFKRLFQAQEFSVANYPETSVQAKDSLSFAFKLYERLTTLEREHFRRGRLATGQPQWPSNSYFEGEEEPIIVPGVTGRGSIEEEWHPTAYVENQAYLAAEAARREALDDDDLTSGL